MTLPIRRIATEEACCVPEVAAALRDVTRGPSSSLDSLRCKGIYDPRPEDGYSSYNWLEGLLDIEGKRLKQMDELGVDMHLLTITATGVKKFDEETDTEFV